MRKTVMGIAAFFALTTPVFANPVLVGFQASTECREELGASAAYVSSVKKKGAAGVHLTVKKNKDSGAKNAEFKAAKEALLVCMKAKLEPQGVKVTSN